MTTGFPKEVWERQAEARRSMWLAGLPRTLTAEEANTEFEFDVPLEEGWSIKLFPDETREEGFSYSYLDPEGWELFPDDTRISPTGETFTMADLMAVPVEPVAPVEAPIAPEAEVMPTPEEDYALLYNEYQRTGGTLDVENWFQFGAPIRPIAQLITDVFPDMTPDAFADYIESDWDGFVEDMRSGGYSEGKESLLKFLGNTSEQIDAFYGTESPLQAIPPEGIEQTINPPSLPAGYGQPAIIRIMPDWEFVGTTPTLRSNDYLIFYEGKQVGKVDSETGGLVMDDPGFWWKAWIPSIQDRLQLSQSGQVPTEAFSGTPLKVQQQFSDWLYTPKKIGETIIPAPATILSAVGAIGTIAITGYYALQSAYQIAARASVTRNVRSWAKSAGVKIPPETERAFVNQAVAQLPKKFMLREAIRTFFNPTKTGYVLSDAGMRVVEQDSLALVERIGPTLVPTATQTGAMAMGGVPINAVTWAAMAMTAKVNLVQSVGLSGQVASKAFEALTPTELTALQKPPVTPEVTIPKIPEARAIELKHHEDLVLQSIKDKPNITFPELEQVTKLQPVQIDGAVRRLGEGIVIKKEGQMTPGGLRPSSYTLTPEGLAIPIAEPGMPEAGLQPSMLPREVPAREVRPPGKGEIVQISMEEQLKLQQARQAAEVAPPEDVEAFEAYAEAEGLKANLELDPIATTRFKFGNRNVALDSFISIREQTFPSYFTLKQAQAIKPNINVTPYSQKGTPMYNRVPIADALDELADKWGMTPDDIADRVMEIRSEKARIRELERIEPIDISKTMETFINEQAQTKVDAFKAYEQKVSSPEAEMEVNRKNNFEAVTQPRQEGEIPRQTVRHPSHYRGMEDFNVEVKRELLSAIPEVPLDIAAVEYLKTGDIAKYVEAMPDVSELKLAALTGEVHTATEELTELKKLAVDELVNLRARRADETAIREAGETVEMWDALITDAEARQQIFGGLIDKAKAKTPLTVDDAVSLGIALRRTKGGKLVAAIRRSGFYVTQEFVDSPYLQDVPYQQGFWEDVDALFEHIDGGRASGTPDAPAVAQKYIQRPSQRNFLAYKAFLDNSFQEAQNMFERFGLTGRVSKKKWADVFNVIEQITAKEADFKTAQLLRKTEIKNILAEYDTQTKQNIVEFAQWSRAYLDQMREMQNLARVKRGQKEIGYIDKYMAWVAERNIWSSLGFSQRTPADMHAQAPAPDYIMPDAPFNARAMTRTGGMKNYTLEKNVHKLLFDYIRTAGKDIFFTNTVQNNKIHIAALKAKGLNSTARLLEEYNAEVWAGAKPRLTKAYEAFLPEKIAKATYIIRRNLTRNVFPLNWIWNITIQPSSIAFTAGRTGFINLAKGLDFIFSPSARAFTRDTYSYIIKSKRAGMMAYQDIGTQVDKSLQFEGSLIDKAEYYASFITNTIESLLTGISIRAGYYKGMKLGFRGQELVEYASKMGAKTQSMYNYENVPAVLRSKAVGAVFPFQTFTIQAMNYIREMNFIRVGRAGAYNTISATSADGKATISRRLMLITSFLISIMVINFAIDKLTNRKPWIVSSFIPMFAILQGAVDPGDAWYLPLPAKYINDFWTGFRDAVKYDDYTRIKRWVLNYHFPFGGTQINRMLDGIEAVLKGAMEDVKGKPKFEVRPDEWLKAISMGPYQTEGGREYIDRLDESKEKKAKWWEYLNIPILIGRLDINSEVEDNLAKLGEIDEDGMRYDFGDLASDIRDIRQSVGDKRFNKSVSPILDGFRKAEASREHYENLPPEKIINMDEYDIANFLFPDPDEKEAEVVELWEKFNTAKTKDERVEVIKEYIEANKKDLKDNELVKNFGLLQDYWSLIGKDKEAFAVKYDALSKEWRSSWRLESPEDDALLAMWGYGGKIQTQKAYDFIIKWCEEYGVDTAHLSTWLPPEGSEKTYFKYQEEVYKRSWNSWEAQLILAQDDNLREALGFDPIETPIAALELKIKNRELFDEFDALETDEERKQYKLDNPLWVDDLRRIEAYENGATEDIVGKWVERGNTIDEFEPGSSEALLWLIDNPDTYDWAIANELLKDRKEELLQREPVLRINVDWATQDAEYDAIDSENREARLDYLDANPQYAIARRKRDAYSMEFPSTEIDNYLAYYDLGARGFRQERMLLDNPGFARAMHELAGIDIPKSRDVPAVQYDDIYDQFKEDFDKVTGLSQSASPYYIEDVDERNRTRQAMRFDEQGKLTEFGLAEIRRNGYGKFVPETHIDAYVGFTAIMTEGKPDNWKEATNQDRWYEDDWFLMERPNFYEQVYLGLLGLEPLDFSRVPSREVFVKWLVYNEFPFQTQKDTYRLENPELDEWGVLAGIWTTTMSEQRRRLRITPTERFLEDVAKRESEFRELLESLMTGLSGLR